MRLNDLDLNQLVILDALLREKNVTRAAERVYLSQSAMSSALRRLRESFRDPLLLTVGRKMVLTPLASELAKPVEEVLLQIRAITLSRPTFNPAVADRTMTVVATDYASTVFLPQVLRRAVKEAPHIKIHLLPVEYKAAEQLGAGEVDFVISAETLLADRCVSEFLFEDTFCCVAWSKNRNLNGALDIETYLKTGHVMAEFSGGRMHTLDDRFLQKLGYERNIEVVVPDFNLLPHMVIGTDRIANLQVRLAKHYARYLPLKLYPIPLSVPAVTEKLQYHKHSLLDPSCTWFRDLLLSEARDLTAPLEQAV